MPAKEQASNDPQKNELEALAEAVHMSWLKDCARVEELQRIDAILKEILTKDNIESYFQNTGTFQYFLNSFSEQVISKILAQSTIFGENGEDFAFDILKDYCLIFIKFHLNPAYSKLWEKMKEIFEPNKAFYTSSQARRISGSKKQINAVDFNSLFLKLKQESKDIELAQEQEVDILVQTKEVYNFWVWVRGVICNVFDEHITIRSPVNETPHIIKKNSYEYAKVGTYTTDWEWRANLKEGDIIDCLERGTYYPATIISRTDSEYRGINKIEYRISFRIYLDSVEDIEKYKIFWKNNSITEDSNQRKYLGDPDNFDETIVMYSKRINPRDSKIWEFMGQRINLSLDMNYMIDELFDNVDKEGKKTITIARNNTYSYFYNSLINFLGHQNLFEQIIDNLSFFNSKEKPISNEVLMFGFNILNNCSEYLFHPYAQELGNLFKDKVFDYLNNLTNSDLRNLKKETLDLISETLKKFLSILYGNSCKENDIYEKFQISFSMKMLKTNFLEKRNSAMKGIIDLIRSSHFDKEKQKNILKIIKENKIIYEIFGPNSHVQLISKSKELLQILLEHDELDMEELNLIWGSTKNGDLEAKLTILKILKDISFSLKPNYIEMLLQSMLNNSEGEMIEDELNLLFDLVGRLVERNDSNPILEKSIDYFFKNLLSFEFEEKEKIQKFIERILSLSRQHSKIKYTVLKKAINLIQEGNNFLIGFKIIHAFKDNFRCCIDEEFNDLFLKDNFIIHLFKDCFDKHITKSNEIMKQENTESNSVLINRHLTSVHTLLEFLLVLIHFNIWVENPDDPENESPIDFVFTHLVEKKICDTDKTLFFTWCRTLINTENCVKKIYDIFTQKICSNEKEIESLNYEGFELFYRIFLQLNENIKEMGNTIYCQIPPQQLEGFDLFWKIIFQSKSKEIMMHGIHILSQLFNTYNDQNVETKEGMQNLIALCINELKKGNKNSIVKSIAMLIRIIEESEKFGTADIVSHMALQSRNRHIICVTPISINNSSEFNLNLPSNTTIFQLKKEISERVNYHYDFIKFELKNYFEKNSISDADSESNDSFNIDNSKENIVLDYQLNGKTFYSLNFPHEISITISPNGLEKTIPPKEILTDGEPTEEVKQIFNDWFDKYSKNGKMTMALCGKFVREVTNSREEIGENDTRVIELFKERDSNQDGLLEREEFVEFYCYSARTKASLVLENIKAMGYRNDLKKMNENYYPINNDKTTMPRYQLAVNEEFFSAIFNSFFPIEGTTNDESKEKLKEIHELERINMDIFQLINQLVTNPKIYDKILNFKDKNWNEVFHEDNIYKMIYSLQIIESFMETVKKGEENNEQFQEWVKLFIENDGYEYLIKIFLKYLSEIQSKKTKISTICFSALIRNIKLLCINAHDGYMEPQLHNFLEQNNLCEKIIKAISAFDIITNLLKILNNFINTKEYEIINEIFELLTLVLPIVNISESFDHEMFLNVVKEGLLNQNIFIREQFFNVILRMICILEDQKKFDLIEVIINFVFQSIKTLDKSKGKISSYLFQLFSILLECYSSNKEQFKNVQFFNDEFTHNICSSLQKHLEDRTIDDIPEDIFIGYIKLISTMSKINAPTKDYISNQTNLITLILTNILFQNSTQNQLSFQPFVTIEEESSLKKSKKSKNEIRKVCYSFIAAMLENSITNIENFFKMDILSGKETEEEDTSSTESKYSAYSYYKRRSEEKKKEGYVGLKNLGCICYMNSSLQQFFMVPTLRFGLLRFDDKEPENIAYGQGGIDDNMFHQTQKLFSYLQLSERLDYNPFGFTYSFKDFEGQPTRISEQKDAQEFLSIFFDRIENACKPTKYKYLIQNIFGGKNCSQIKCQDCHKIKNRFEDLLFLSLQVKNMKNLNESLLKQIAEERIDGYECEGCKKKVTISKRNILASLPNVLIVHLQRILYNFEYDHNEKINSYLEFPRHLNLKQFTLEELSKKSEQGETDEIYYRADEYYNYYLVGVVIHVGSADSGHYYSYINTIRGGQGDVADYDENDKKMDSCWLEYNDSNISKFNLENLESECFGGSTQNEGSGYFWGGGENCKNAYLLVYERKIKMPLKVVVKEEKVQKKINDGLKLIEIQNEKEEKEINKKYDLLRYYGTSKYEEMCKELYSSIFHDVERKEYYIYEPFYFKKKKIPRKYYTEIMSDNNAFEKTQNIADQEFTNFIKQIISLLERTLINSAEEVNQENLQRIANSYLDFVFNILTKKDKLDFLEQAKDKLMNIVKKIPSFQEYIWEYLSTKQNIYNQLLNEKEEVVTQLSKLIYELIEHLYKINPQDFETVILKQEIESKDCTLIKKIFSVLNRILKMFPAIKNKYIQHIEPILYLFKQLNALCPIIKNFYKEEDYIPKMITFLLGKDSPYYNKTLGDLASNWDYGIRSDIPGAQNIIEVIFDIVQNSRLVLKTRGLELSEDDTKCICSPAFLKYVFGKNEEYFQSFLIMLNRDNMEFTLFSCGELLKNLEGLNIYQSRAELLSVMTCCQKLLQIKDDYQQIRFEILFGIPQHEVKVQRRGRILPLVGYNVLNNPIQCSYKYKSPIFQSEKITTILSKISEIKNISKLGAEIFLSMLKECTTNDELFKYFALMPYESISYKSFIEFGSYLVKSASEDDNEMAEENNKYKEILTQKFTEISQNEELKKLYPGFIGGYLMNSIKRAKILKIFEEQNISVFLIDYTGDTMKYDEPNEIDFSNSLSNYSMYNTNLDKGEIVEEENLTEEELEKENIKLLDTQMYNISGEEKFMKDVNSIFKSDEPKAIILQNKFSVPNSKSMFRRLVAINNSYDDMYLCVKCKRNQEVLAPNEYLPVTPIVFRICSETKEIFNVAKLDLDKEWTFDENDFQIEIGTSFFGIEFPNKIRF